MRGGGAKLERVERVPLTRRRARQNASSLLCSVDLWAGTADFIHIMRKKGSVLGRTIVPQKDGGSALASSMASSSLQELAAFDSIIVTPRARAQLLPHLK